MVIDRLDDMDFTLEVEAAGKVVSLPTGQWSVDTVARYEAALRTMLRRHQTAEMPLRLLVDLRERRAHPQDVAQKLQAAFARIAPRFDRIAIVLPYSAIMAIQAKRVANRSNITDERQRHFDPEHFMQAHLWLDERRSALSTTRAA